MQIKLQLQVPQVCVLYLILVTENYLIHLTLQFMTRQPDKKYLHSVCTFIIQKIRKMWQSWNLQHFALIIYTQNIVGFMKYICMKHAGWFMLISLALYWQIPHYYLTVFIFVPYKKTTHVIIQQCLSSYVQHYFKDCALSLKTIHESQTLTTVWLLL